MKHACYCSRHYFVPYMKWNSNPQEFLFNFRWTIHPRMSHLQVIFRLTYFPSIFLGHHTLFSWALDSIIVPILSIAINLLVLDSCMNEYLVALTLINYIQDLDSLSKSEKFSCHNLGNQHPYQRKHQFTL